MQFVTNLISNNSNKYIHKKLPCYWKVMRAEQSHNYSITRHNIFVPLTELTNYVLSNFVKIHRQETRIIKKIAQSVELNTK